MLPLSLIDDYRATRLSTTNHRVLCHAPFVSLNFDQSGAVSACCFSREFPLGHYPKQTLREIWAASAARELRAAFLEGRRHDACSQCFGQLSSRNFGGVLMRNFDEYAAEQGYEPHLDVTAPRVLEFELSNVCNLECVMCGGHWSSAIRRNRERLPPLSSPYDQAFVSQLQEFLPSIEAAKFLGGEPFLIKIYYDIWERIVDINPGITLTITTNGTTVPDRAKELLEKLRANIVLSLDAMTPQAFEAIRLNARFLDVMRNFDYFLDYTRRAQTELRIATCPIRSNWRELPLLLAFAEENHLPLSFNTVLRPSEHSLGGLTPDELSGVAAELERAYARRPVDPRNKLAWEGLVAELRGWTLVKGEFQQRCARTQAEARAFVDRHDDGGEGWTASRRMLDALVRSYEAGCAKAKLDFWAWKTLLIPLPVQLVESGPALSFEDTAVALFRFARFLDEQREGTRIPIGSLETEERSLREGLLGWHTGPSAEFHRWLCNRIEQGEPAQALEWVKNMVFPRSIERESGFPPDTRAWQAKLAGSLQGMRARGLDEGACQVVAMCFETLVEQARQSPDHVPQVVNDASVLQDDETLRHALEAVCLFHEYTLADSAAGDALRNRLYVGRSEAQRRRLGGMLSTHLFATYQFLSTASDQEVDVALAGSG